MLFSREFRIFATETKILTAMNKEEKFVITISRQFGTGGHEIGAELARRLGVKLLDKQTHILAICRHSVV